MRIPGLKRERGRVDDATVELQLLAGMLQATARHLRRGDINGHEFAREAAAQLHDVETRLQTLRLEIAAAPYVGASGASVIEHDGQIYLVGAPIEHHQVGDKPCFRQGGVSYAVTVAFRTAKPVARPIRKGDA